MHDLDERFGARKTPPTYYPESPGSKAAGPSVEAAKAIAGRAWKIREEILRLLTRRPMSADEMAAGLGESPLFIRPRFSELRAAGLIEPTGERRRNESGMSASVWRRTIAPPVVPEAPADDGQFRLL